MDVQERYSDYVFTKCFNSSIIRNKYDGKEYAVRCRYCPSCLTQRGDMLAQRLSNEFKYGKFRYPLFVTFTYDEEHLPMFYRCWNDDGTLSPFYISAAGQVISAKNINEDELPNQDFRDFSSLVDAHDKYVYSAFAAFNVKDLQDCFKRMRIRLRRKHGFKKDCFRYFFVSEYGSMRFRPHYHGFIWCSSSEVRNILLRWFDSSAYSEQARNYLGLLSPWKNGRTDAQIPRENEAVDNYISRYITSFGGSINFTVKGFRPFYICSKNPLVGANPRETSHLEASFAASFRDLSRISAVYDKKAGDGRTVIPVLYSASARYTIFPRCTQYAVLSQYQRAGVYSFLSSRPSAEITHLTEYAYVPEKMAVTEVKSVEIDGVRFSSADFHCMKVFKRLHEKYGITVERYLEIMQDFYTSYYSQLLGMQCQQYSDYFDEFGNNMYIFQSDMVFTRNILDEAYRRTWWKPSTRLMLDMLFPHGVPSRSQIRDYINNNIHKLAYEKKIKDRVQRNRKTRYDNEYFGSI